MYCKKKTTNQPFLWTSAHKYLCAALISLQIALRSSLLPAASCSCKLLATTFWVLAIMTAYGLLHM